MKTFFTKKTKKIIALTLISSFVFTLYTTPKEVDAIGLPIPGIPGLPGIPGIPGLGGGTQQVEEVGEILKKEVGKKIGISIGPISIGLPVPTGGDGLAWMVAKMLISKITQSLVSWANNGFDGDPLFAVRPGEFLLETADNVAGDFIKSAGFGALCSPFRLEVQIAVLDSYNNSRVRSRDPYQASCTLSGIIGNVDSFISGDFSQGGWGGWFNLTQTPQGNPYSAVLDARDQLSLRVGAEVGIESTRLNWNRGFLSYSECVRTGPNGRCVERGPTQTPGSIIEGKLIESFGSDIRQLEMADELDEVLAGVMTKFIGSFLSGGKHVFSNTGSGIADQLAIDLAGGGDTIPGLPPSLTLTLYGADPFIIYTGGIFFEPGYFATDPREGDLTRSVITSGFIDTSTPGVYPITYSVSNSYGASAQAVRTVIVQDYVPPPTTPGTGTGTTNTPPQIRLAAPTTMNLALGESYFEPGFVAFDQEDGSLSNSSVVVNGAPTDTSFPANYTIMYTVTDSGGLSTTEVRFVVVGGGGPAF